MAPQHVGEIEEGRTPVGAGVEDGKHSLEVAIQVYNWRYVAAKLQQIVARVPPAMRNACGQDGGASRGHDDPFATDEGAESSRFHKALFQFAKVHVQRRAFPFGRKRAIEEEDDSSLRVAPAMHPQDFAGMAVLQLQKVIHGSFYLWPDARQNESYES